MKKQKIFHVLIVVSLQSAAGRKKFSGINRFLGQGFDWDFELLRSDTDITPERISAERAKGYDGFLILAPQAPKLKPSLTGCSTPVVFTASPDLATPRELPFAVFLLDDDRSIMRRAIDHLLSLPRIASLGFVPTRSPCSWSIQREANFKTLMAKANVPHAIYRGDGESMDELAHWIKTLPKPTGLIAAYDDRARDVLEAARKGDLHVPSELSVLGIGNDEPICEMTHPPLSSVAVDFAEEGYRAARELQAMMLRRIRPSHRVITVGTGDVIVRGSTAATTNNAALVRRALNFIEQYACEGIGVDDVVTYLHISRRLAYLRFREIANTTILNAILDQRIMKAKRLLEKTKKSVTEIALECGYKDNNYFKNVFRRITGASPSDWRQAKGARTGTRQT